MSDLAMMSGTVQMEGEWGGRVVPADRRMARFQTVPKLNRVETEKQGRPIYDAQIVLFVRQPGERDETAIEMREHHKYEFPRQWQAFEAGRSPEAQGTPLDILFPNDPQIVAHLRGAHIFSVDQLATVSAEGRRRIGMGADAWIQRAQQFIDAADKAAPMHQMEGQLRQRDEEIALLKQQVAMLADSVTRRGRKRRDETDPEGEE